MEKKSHRLRIIMGASGEDIRQHAVEMVEAIEKHDRRNPYHSKPRGVAAHLTRFPIVCDDCDETFWANDPYAVHQRCGKSRPSFGF